MLFKYSLSQNKQPLTHTVVADRLLLQACGVLYEVRTKCHVDLLVFKALMSLAPSPL
jgi:hypothetical protein